MSSQREQSLDNFLGEIRDMRERMKGILPSYTGSLKGLYQLPEELERRFWASRVEALLQMVKADYQDSQAKAHKVDLLGKFMTGGMNIALMTGRMQPMPALHPTRLGISISPSGKIAPALFDDPHRQPGVVLISFKEFEGLTLRLRDRILKGIVMPKNDDEIPKLIHSLALEHE